MKAVLAAISTLGNNKDDLKDLHSPKGKQPRYKALILGTCHLQEPGKRETAKERNRAKQENSHPQDSIPVSLHFWPCVLTFSRC